MNFSARRSSSSIVTPGWSCSPTNASVSATTAPARAMPSISCWDLRMITAASSAGADLLDDLLDLGEHLVDGAIAVDADEVPRQAVVLDERLGLLVVEREPAADRVGRVVGAALVLRAPREPVDRDR